jgi:hypothetical protein
MIVSFPFAGLFGGVPAGQPDRVERIAVGAAKAGAAVVLVTPGQRKPLCPLTTRQIGIEDRKAQREAKEAGDRHWARKRHPCGIDHAFTDPAPLQRAIRRLAAMEDPIVPNLGLELGASRMVVVDVDTAEQDAAFLADWATESGEDQSHRRPTVRSPGQVRADGGWTHKDGGHYWFTLPPDVELPGGQGVMKAAGGYTVMWSRCQVLVPPSSRPEGNYELQGDAEALPGWLVARVMLDVEGRRERVQRRLDTVLDGGKPDEQWQAVTPWAELLEPDGWTPTGLVDTCSCPTWTAPGSHASSKSAVAHDVGCTKFDVSTGWGPLYVWTDDPPGWMTSTPCRKTFTKVQYVCWRDHDGDFRAAFEAIGLGPPEEGPGPISIEYGWDADDPGVPAAGGPDDDPPAVKIKILEHLLPEQPSESQEILENLPFDVIGAPVPPADDESAPAGPVRPTKRIQAPGAAPERTLKVTRASDIRMRATRWLWQDGDAHWLPLGGLALLGGREGIGKSTIAYGLAAQVTRGTLPGASLGTPRQVIIAATEDAWEQTVVPRLAACGADLARVMRVDTVTKDGATVSLSVPADTASLQHLCVAQDVALVLLDPLMGTISGKLDTHKDAEVRQALEPLSRLAHDAQVTLLGLIHVNKSTGADLLTRLMASRAFSAVARAVLFATKNDQVPDVDLVAGGTTPPAETFLLGQPKNNLAAKVPFSLRYHIDGTQVGYDEELCEPIFGSRIVWDGRQEERVDDLVQQMETRKAHEHKPVGKAASWLREYLRGGQVPSRQVKQDANDAGFSESTLKRAFQEINGQVINVGRTTHWRLLNELCGLDELSEPSEPSGLGNTGHPDQLAHGSGTGTSELNTELGREDGA